MKSPTHAQSGAEELAVAHDEGVAWWNRLRARRLAPGGRPCHGGGGGALGRKRLNQNANVLLVDSFPERLKQCDHTENLMQRRHHQVTHTRRYSPSTASFIFGWFS